MSHVSSALHLTSQCQEPLASQGLMSQGLMSHVASQSEGAGTLAAEGKLAAAKGCRQRERTWALGILEASVGELPHLLLERPRHGEERVASRVGACLEHLRLASLHVAC
jgi:hypothetical protein